MRGRVHHPSLPPKSKIVNHKSPHSPLSFRCAIVLGLLAIKPWARRPECSLFENVGGIDFRGLTDAANGV